MLVVGIAGGSGCGKTTVVKKIMEQLPESQVTILPQDAQYKDNSHLRLEDRKKLNFDHPDAIEFSLLQAHIKELKEGRKIERPVYSMITCTREEETVTVAPKDVVIVEGILLMTQKKLRDLFDIKVFVDTDSDVRLMRIIKRDTEQRGRDVKEVLHRYEEVVKPMYEQFIEPSKKFVDVIVPQGGQNKVAIAVLSSTVELYLKNKN